eukprot:XP_011683476.1 PREDICTED: uncharacterized protein LOC105447306 [Strongylocentrotus purpuratus]
MRNELARTASSSTYQQHAEAEMRRKREEMEERRQVRQVENERDKLHARRKIVQSDVARANLKLADTSMRRDEEVRRRLDDLEKELRSAELSRLNDENREVEEEVQTVLHRLADAKRDHAVRLQHEYDDLRSKSQPGW